MITIDKLAYNSRLKDIDPMEKLVFTGTSMGVCLWADRIPISLAVLCLMMLVTWRMGRTSPRVFLRLLGIPMAFLLLGVLTIAFGIATTPDRLLVSVPVLGSWVGLSATGIAQAWNLFFKALGATGCLYFLALSTPMVDLLNALRKLKCPSLLVELMGLIYRFIFVLLETADTMYLAQNARLGYTSLFSGYRSLGALASTLFIRAYRRSDELYTALESRGYEGELTFLEPEYRRNPMHYAAAVLVNSLLVGATLGLFR